MADELTERQKNILGFITASIGERGYPPTLREIGLHFGIRSTNGVNDHLKALEKKGHLTREDLKSRAMRPVAEVVPILAPYKVAVLPLLKKRPEIVDMCHRLLRDLKRDMMAVYDDTAAIGKLYRRQDEIGTPWCVTVDVDSLEDGAVTIRDRDSMTQERVPLENVKRVILDRMAAVRP